MIKKRGKLNYQLYQNKKPDDDFKYVITVYINKITISTLKNMCILRFN